MINCMKTYEARNAWNSRISTCIEYIRLPLLCRERFNLQSFNNQSIKHINLHKKGISDAFTFLKDILLQSHLVKKVLFAQCKHCNKHAEQRIYSFAMLQCFKHQSATNHDSQTGVVSHFLMLSMHSVDFDKTSSCNSFVSQVFR